MKAIPISRFRGVYWTSSVGRWTACEYGPRGYRRRIAFFDTEHEAAIAVDRVSLHTLGRSAPRNLPARRVRPASVEEIRAEVRKAKKAQTSSQYIGVQLLPETDRRRNIVRPWQAFLSVEGRPLNLGGWATERDAAIAHDRAALFYRRRDPPLNFPAEARRLQPADAHTLRRLCTRARKETTTSQYLGVSWFAGSACWRAVITHENVKHHLGLFDNELDAARAYDAKASAFRGDDAKLNFPVTSRVASAERPAGVVPGRIVRDGRMADGQPVVRGSRILVSSVLDLLAQGESTERILRDTPTLTAEDLQAVIAFAAAMARAALATRRPATIGVVGRKSSPTGGRVE